VRIMALARCRFWGDIFYPSRSTTRLKGSLERGMDRLTDYVGVDSTTVKLRHLRLCGNGQELHFGLLEKRERNIILMRLPDLFSKKVLIRLEGNGTFASTVKYGCFYSRTKEFDVGRQFPVPALSKAASLLAYYLVPLYSAASPKKRGSS